MLDVAVELFTTKVYDDVSLDEVGTTAEVSRRTVLRRFGSKEELFVNAATHAAEQMKRARNEAPVGDVEAAIANVIDHYERWGDYRLRLIAQEDRIPVIAEDVRFGRQFHWAWVERVFAPLIRATRGVERKQWIATLVMVTDVFTWRLLRRDLGMSRQETEQLLIGLVRKLTGGD